MECRYEREHSIPVDDDLAPPVTGHRSAMLVVDVMWLAVATSGLQSAELSQDGQQRDSPRGDWVGQRASFVFE
jgi:hypothetical protein